MSTPGGDVKRINTFLELVVSQKGSDLHLVSGQPPRIRLYGDLIPIKYRELSADETAALLAETMTDEVRQHFEARYSLDFAYEVPGLARFRVNAFRHLHGLGAVFRVIPNAIRTAGDLRRATRAVQLMPGKQRPHPRHRANRIREIDHASGHD